MKGLQPHLALAAYAGVTPGPAGGLHQQAKQALGCPEVAGKKRPVGVDRGHQGDAAKVVPLGNHLCAHQHVDVAGMHLCELRFQAAFESGAVGINAGNAHGLALGLRGGRGVGATHASEQLRQMLFKPLSAPAHGRNVGIAAGRAGARHRLGETAVVAAQSPVDFVKHAVGAAVRAFAFPIAVPAVQHGGIAAPV